MKRMPYVNLSFFLNPAFRRPSFCGRIKDIRKKEDVILKKIAVFLVFLSVLTLAYWPAVSQDYAHHDSYRFFEDTHGQDYIHPFLGMDMAIGRFVGAFLQISVGRHIHLFGELKYLRIYSLVCLVFCAYLFFIVLNRFYDCRVISLSVSFIIFSLPAFCSLVCLTASFWKMTAVVFTMIAGYFALKLPTHRIALRILGSKYALLSILSLFLAYATYQSTASFYWAIVMIVFFFARGETFRARLINFTGVGMLAMSIYFFYLKSARKVFLLLGVPAGGYSPFRLESQIWGKILWFFHEPLANVLNLWNIFPDPWITLIAATVVILLVMKKSLRVFSDRSWRKTARGMILNFLGFGIICLLSFLPNFLSTGNFAFYRCLSGLYAILILLILWALEVKETENARKKNFFTGGFILLAGFGLLAAHQTILKYRVYPSQVEYQFLKHAFLNTEVGSEEQISLIRPDIRKIKHRYDEFATPATYYPQSLQGMLRAMIADLDEPKKMFYEQRIARVVLLPVGYPLGEEFSGRYTVIIDMNRLYQPGGPLAYLAKE